MSLFQEDHDVGGVTYTISQFPGMKSAKMLTRLLRIVGEPLGVAAGGVDPSTLNLRLDDVLPKCLAALTDRLDEKEVEKLITDLMSAVTVQNKPVNIDIQFQGKIGHMFRVLGLVISVNYRDFLDAALAQFKMVMAKKEAAAAPSKSQKRSLGSAGA